MRGKALYIRCGTIYPYVVYRYMLALFGRILADFWLLFEYQARLSCSRQFPKFGVSFSGFVAYSSGKVSAAVAST